MTHSRVSLAAACGLAPLAAACNNEGLLTPPVPPYAGGALFQRYVSLGNSITAGFPSGGLNDSPHPHSPSLLLGAPRGAALPPPTRTPLPDPPLLCLPPPP